MARRLVLSLALVLVLPSIVLAQGRPDPATLVAAQRDALKKLPAMDGTWRGKARILEAGGAWKEHAQTERVGAMLDGTVRVIEGTGYDADGKKVFNALAVIAWDTGKQAYSMRSYSSGRMGDFSFAPSDTGFVWEIPAGPMTIRYTATVRDGKWHEVGDRIAPGQEPVRFIEIDLARIGATEWPAGGAVQPK